MCIYVNVCVYTNVYLCECVCVCVYVCVCSAERYLSDMKSHVCEYILHRHKYIYK